MHSAPWVFVTLALCIIGAHCFARAVAAVQCGFGVARQRMLSIAVSEFSQAARLAALRHGWDALTAEWAAHCGNS